MSTEFEEKPTRQTSVYRALGQGLKTLHDPQYAEVDILAIPGLGTDPIECWTWKPSAKDAADSDGQHGSPVSSGATGFSRNKFNWLRDPDGLASLFPKARIMLYDYASAWKGKFKVRATMKSICTWLLDDLREKRKGGNEITRPLIIIGHSMGGIVAAKTLCIARAQREFEPILTSTIGCAFFGVPFRGSDMAKIALLYSSVFGNDAYESLLSFMRTEKNDTLDEVTNDFMEICKKLAPPVDLFCAWEQNPTAVSYSDKVASKVPGLLQQQFFKAGARKFMETGFSAFGTGTHFVERESAELQGAHSVGMTAGHSDLVQFESITSTKFGPVKVALSNMVHMAKINARKRAILSGERLLPQRFVNQVRQSLEGVDMRSKFRTSVGQRMIATWLTSEPSYQKWLSPGSVTDSHHSYLWLKGGAGLGKTNASLAAIQQLGDSHADRTSTENTGAQNENFLAYFLCERLPGYCTAEDVLKSLIIQMINQEESLAQHARWFVPNPRYRGPTHLDNRHSNDQINGSGAKATTTVDNLWKCLQDMIEDPVVNSIHIVLSNMHYLDSTVSTTALLAKLRTAAFDSMSQAACRAKWMLTSRGDRHIRDYLTAECVAVIDLDNNMEYGGKVKAARQTHARDAVVRLRQTKQYSPDLAYWIRNFVESQSEDEKWIDILCILLRAKPSDTSNLTIRKWLRETGGHSIHDLVDHAWDTVLNQDEGATLETEELIQTLTIAYEPPNLAELAVLTQLDDVQRLSALVQKCSPVVQIRTDGKVAFTRPEFKDRLSDVFFGHPDTPSDARKRYHGLMALRCFKYIKASYDISTERDHSSKITSEVRLGSLVSPASPTQITASIVNDSEILLIAHDDDMTHMADPIIPSLSTLTCSYPVRYLFQHLSEGFPDAVHELFEDDPDFWGGQSITRDRWLEDFQSLTMSFKDLNTGGMSTLHVAAGIGANDLVSILIDRNGNDSSSWTNKVGMTALHVAAINNHCDAVETLIRAGADIEAGAGEAGTPLHLAALRGNCAVMALLIERKANINAFSSTIGPVINAAIRSGTVDAVQLIMNGDVHFGVDYTKCETPLSLSAGISEPSLFEDILNSGRSKWLQNVKLLDQALVAASESGRLQSVCILLKFGHIFTNNTLEAAVLSAALEKNWSTVNELLDYAIEDTAQGNRRDVKLDEAFYLAATSREEHLLILEKIWTLTNQSIAQDIRNVSLYQASVLNKDSTVDWLLDKCDVDPNASADRSQSILSYANAASSADFWNPINAAASSGNASMVRALIQKGAEVDGERVYALQLAAREGHTDAVEVLLQHGATANKVVADSEELGFFGATALQAACDNKRVGVVEALIKHGADPNLGGGAFTSPIIAATQKAQHEILKLLVEAPGIDVNVFSSEHESSPLINAATYMSVDSVELLIRHGADLDTKDAAGDTALIKAAWKGDKECVTLLCNKGADVTYRSPLRGLPISAAANGQNPACATILADRMGAKIERYRKQVQIDPSKERLSEAITQLKIRDETIHELNAALTESQEQLDSANKDIDFHKHEKKRLISASSFQGESYESAGQQMRAMQNERAELLKQLDAARGQNSLANESVDRVQALLNSERKANQALRKRQELASLQDEVKAGHEKVEMEKQKNTGLHHDIRSLQNTITALRDEVVSVQAGMQAAMQASHVEQQKQESLKEEIKVWEDRYRAEVLASAQAAAERHATHQRPGLQRSYNDLDSSGGKGYPELEDVTKSPRSQTTSPNPQARSPESENGFMTIHGRHRPDGAFGGYRTDRTPQREHSENLYESSILHGRSGERTLSTQTSRSDGPSAKNEEA